MAVEAKAKLEEQIKRRGELARAPRIAVAEAQAAAEVRRPPPPIFPAAQVAETVLAARASPGATSDPLVDSAVAQLAGKFQKRRPTPSPGKAAGLIRGRTLRFPERNAARSRRAWLRPLRYASAGVTDGGPAALARAVLSHLHQEAPARCTRRSKLQQIFAGAGEAGSVAADAAGAALAAEEGAFRRRRGIGPVARRFVHHPPPQDPVP